MNNNQWKYMQQLYEREVAEGRLYGCSVLVGTQDGPAFIGEYGEMKRDSICMLCSMTKPITALAAWIAIERGAFDPMEPLSKYLPGFSEPKVSCADGLVPAEREILVRDVLNMTSGIPATRARNKSEERSASVMQQVMLDAKRRIDAGETVSNVEILNGLGAAPLLFQPGARWDYGKNADILGGVIEVATGKTLGDFFREELFEPLGMHDTDFIVPKEKIGRVARIAAAQPDGTIREITSQDFYGDHRALWEKPYIESGGGGCAPIMCRGVYSTLEDYAKLGQMLLCGGVYKGKRILSESTVRLFSTNHLTKEQAKGLFPGLHGYGYGNLMRVLVDRGAAHCAAGLGEFGWDGALGTYFSVDPEAGIYIVSMQQKVVDPIVRRKMRNIIYSAID